MKKIIGICGFIGSGKGTVGDILVSSHNFQRIAFADKLKDSVAVLFDMPRNLLEGDTEESRIWRETPNEFWSRELKRDITPRFILQVMGTECMRNGFNHDIWMLIVKNKILQNPNTNWVISDVRFRNEQNMIRSLNGEIWQIRRGELPEWYSAAVLDNNEQSNLMDSYKIHDSEWRWIDHDDQFNQIIKNDQTLDDLKQTIKSIL